jgi:hypothetical protein
MFKKFVKRISTLLFFILSFLILCAWGSTGHHIISLNATKAFTGKAQTLSFISSFIIAHASDADYRKDKDPTEGPKHFIDIDSYQEFVKTGKISQNYDTVVALHESNFVIEQGILPWAIINTFDSLETAFKRNDWIAAEVFAADLGHYVGDSHQPLHLTSNYDGQKTGQSGVHSRYETTMIGKYSGQITYNVDSVVVIPNVANYVFNYIYENYKYKDSILFADKEATNFAGSISSTAYLPKFWELTGGFTTLLMKNASDRLANLIYTAWVEAGAPIPNSTGVKPFNNDKPLRFKLGQNYPNPFNPSTSIKYQVPKTSFVSLKVYDNSGKEVAILINEKQEAGEHIAQFIVSGRKFASGIYYYRLNTADYVDVKKMILLK